MSRYVRRARRRGRRGAIYARFSSRFQHSIDDQVRECRRWAEENGIEVLDDHVFVDERQTGKKSRRKGFNSLMSAVREGKVDVVIIFTTSRLFRKTYKTVRFVEEEIVDRRIRCVFVKSHIDTDDEDNWRKLLHIHGMVDEMTLQVQVAHIRAAHEGQLRMGVVFGTLTYGYTGQEIEGPKTRLGKPRRKLVIDPTTSKWVQQIFAWFVNDVTIQEIARRLNAAGAPPPDRYDVQCWSPRIVRRILDNPRYIGLWQYGATEAVWQNSADYSRQFDREEPLAQQTFEHLRIIDERTWHQAQQKLLDYHRRAGRKSKDGDRVCRPRVLSGLCVCEKHLDQELWVGGAHGKYMFCPRCRTDAQPALVSQLPRQFATERLFKVIATLLRKQDGLEQQIIHACMAQVERHQKPEPAELEEKQRTQARLTRDIQFIMNAPGETEEDRTENQARLLELRRQRAEVASQLQQLQAAAMQPAVVPTVQQVRELLDRCADVLTEAASSGDEEKRAAARRILVAVTGGRIVISQHGERSRRKGWLKGSFTPHLIGPVVDELGVSAAVTSAVPMEIDFKRPTPAEQLADEAKELWDQNLLMKQIPRKLSETKGKKIGRNYVAKALEHWFTSRGLPVPDGRSRRSTLENKTLDPQLYQRLADSVMELVAKDLLYEEISEKLNSDRNTVTAAVKYWHEQRGLPVPDGRSRRKELLRQSRGWKPRHLLSSDPPPEAQQS